MNKNHCGTDRINDCWGEHLPSPVHYQHVLAPALFVDALPRLFVNRVESGRDRLHPDVCLAQNATKVKYSNEIPNLNDFSVNRQTQ